MVMEDGVVLAWLHLDLTFFDNLVSLLFHVCKLDAPVFEELFGRLPLVVVMRCDSDCKVEVIFILAD